MNGTEKQIVWAEDIKNNALNGHVHIPLSGYVARIAHEETKLDNSISKLSQYDGEKRARREQSVSERRDEIANLHILVKIISTKTDAKWFIDNRNTFGNLHFETLDAFIAKNNGE